MDDDDEGGPKTDVDFWEECRHFINDWCRDVSEDSEEESEEVGHMLGVDDEEGGEDAVRVKVEDEGVEMDIKVEDEGVEMDVMVEDKYFVQELMRDAAEASARAREHTRLVDDARRHRQAEQRVKGLMYGGSAWGPEF